MRNKMFQIIMFLSVMFLAVCIYPKQVMAMDGSLKIQMYNGTTSTITNSININFKVVNTGNTSINLSEVKLRYYYAADGSEVQNFWCDFAGETDGSNYAIITDKVTGSFINMGESTNNADTYLEIGFASDAGTLNPGNSVDIQTRIAKSDWTNYSQTNDYSFNPLGAPYADWPKVTAYIGGNKVWGGEPMLPPKGLSAIGRNGYIYLNWNTVTGASWYNVCMIEADGTSNKVMSVPVTRAGFTAENGTTYRLAVSAGNEGGDSENSSEISVTPLLAATVTGVSSTTASGSYKEGGNIAITVTFNRNVNVDTAGGTPVLHLETGTTDSDATYLSGDGTSTLTFNYSVQKGDTTSRLDYIAADSLDLKGGTIKDAVTDVAADLTLPAPGALGSLGNAKAIVVDTTTPTWITTYPKLGTINSNSVSVLAEINETGKAYWVCVISPSNVLTADQVKLAQNSLGNSVGSGMSGSMDLTANDEGKFTVNGLSASVKYDIYLAVEDEVGNLQAAVTKISVVPKIYTLTYKAGPNGKVTGTTTQIVSQGNNGTEVEAVANPGYHFVKWSDNITATARTDKNVQNNINVTANFEADVPASSATVGDVTVDGTQNIKITSKDVVITLVNDVLKSEINAGDNLANWITNLPDGLTAIAKSSAAAGAKEVTITIEGTPIVTSGAAMDITIPAASLISNANLIVEANGNAKFAIVAPSVLTPAYIVEAAAGSLAPTAGAENEITLIVKDSSGNTDTSFNGPKDVKISGYTEAPNNSYGSFNGTALSASPNTISVTFKDGIAKPKLVLNNAALQSIVFEVTGVNAPATSPISMAPAPYIPPYVPPYIPPTPQPTTETRQVPVVVENGNQQSTAVQTTITRTTDTSGVKTDTVKFDETTAAEAVKKASETKSSGAAIDISDTSGNSADNTEFQLPAASMNQFANNNMSLSLKTEKAALEIPAETIEKLGGQDAAVKISEEKDSSKIENNKALVLKLASGAQIITTPLNIEASITGRTKITIPIDSSKLPSAKEELEKFLSSLAVMVHHSDGEDVVDKGTIVYDEKGNAVGISIWVDKFSSFTLIETPKDYFQGKTTVMKDKVDTDKEWSIKFTKAADAATVTKDNVYVTDSKGNKVDVKVSYGSDNILKVSPVNPYISGETYYLYVSKNVKAKDKTPLVNELRYQFIIK